MNSEPIRVEYCLECGGTISYTYTPGSSVCWPMMQLIQDYWTKSGSGDYVEMYARPEILRSLIKETWNLNLALTTEVRSLMYSEPRIMGVRVRELPTLPIPFLYGTPRELEECDFYSLLDKVLS